MQSATATGMTLLMTAVVADAVECVSVLLSRAFSVCDLQFSCFLDQRTRDGETALTMALAKRHPRCVWMLFEYGARCLIGEDSSSWPLCACVTADHDVLFRMCWVRVSRYLRTVHGLSVLRLCCAHHASRCLRIVLEDPAVRDTIPSESILTVERGPCWVVMHDVLNGRV